LSSVFFHQEELKVGFLTILWTVFDGESNTEIWKIFQQQVFRKNEKKINGESD
jgi:hypothetical protein